MRIISFNVNGIRSMIGKLKNGEKNVNAGDHCLKSLIEEQRPDILCLQEVKTQSESDLEELSSHFTYLFTNFSKNKKGYSGVSLMTNLTPEWVSYDFSLFEEDRIGKYEESSFVNEGRLIAVKFAEFIAVTVYVPNAQPELARIQERLQWENLLRKYLKALEEDYQVPVVLCGDLNVAPTDKDIHRKQPKGTPGASAEERGAFQQLVEAGFVDSFRALHPAEMKYTYWSNFAKSRERNKGWRIDMVMVSEHATDRITHSDCLTEYMGSDHCPVVCDIAF